VPAMTLAFSGFRKWINILLFILTIAVNSLAGSTTILGGQNTAQISGSNPTLITPAGYVFSIWGIIYVLLGIFVVYQALPSQQGREFQKKIGWLFALSCIANIAWIFLWQFEYLVFSIFLMFLLLTTLILIYVRLGVGKVKVPRAEKLAVHLAFSVYLGWITIASIANVAVTIVSLGWDGFSVGAQMWSAILLTIALVITMVILVIRKDIAYALVVIWALVGIAMNQTGNIAITILAELAALLVAVGLFAEVIVGRLRSKSSMLVD
jgi:benzodiazapine receptor